MNKLFSFEKDSGKNFAESIYGQDSISTEHEPHLEIFQGYDDTCAVRSQQIILRDFGVDVSQEQLMQFAEENGWYQKGGGTPMAFVGYILQGCGVNVHQQEDCNVYDLVNELAQGHRVIVGVDSGELWADKDSGTPWYERLTDKASEWFEDQFHGENGADHALIVAGVEVDQNNPENTKVILTDPGTGDLRIEYSLDEFMDAWKDSNCFMVATNDAAPYQYNPDTGKEEPSNFSTQAYIENNSYPLSQDDLFIPDNYVAAHYDEGHLNTVGNNSKGESISYDKFDSTYESYEHALADAKAQGLPGLVEHAESLWHNLFNPDDSEGPIYDPGDYPDDDDDFIDDSGNVI